MNLKRKKIISNSRKKSGKALGGQKGYSIYKLEKLKQEEITEEENHELRQCECCGGKIKEYTSNKSSIETSRRHEINERAALRRLVLDNPYILKEF